MVVKLLLAELLLLLYADLYLNNADNNISFTNKKRLKDEVYLIKYKNCKNGVDL